MKFVKKKNLLLLFVKKKFFVIFYEKFDVLWFCFLDVVYFFEFINLMIKNVICK